MNDLFSVKDKVVLISGGAQGLGFMMAEGFVRAGANVYITSRKADACQQAEQQLKKLGNCTAINTDLDSSQAINNLADVFRQHQNSLDVLINNAGLTWGAPLAKFPDKAWQKVMSVNVQGPFTLVQALLNELVCAASKQQDNPARIINIGSIAGKKVERISAYSYEASKAAIHHLSRVLAAELAQQNITVNTVVPGYFPTKMTAHIRSDEQTNNKMMKKIPLKRFGSAQDIVAACIYLASRSGSYITGSELVVDGGLLGAC